MSCAHIANSPVFLAQLLHPLIIISCNVLFSLLVWWIIPSANYHMLGIISNLLSIVSVCEGASDAGGLECPVLPRLLDRVKWGDVLRRVCAKQFRKLFEVSLLEWVCRELFIHFHLSVGMQVSGRRWRRREHVLNIWLLILPLGRRTLNVLTSEAHRLVIIPGPCVLPWLWAFDLWLLAIRVVLLLMSPPRRGAFNR